MKQERESSESILLFGVFQTISVDGMAGGGGYLNPNQGFSGFVDDGVK